MVSKTQTLKDLEDALEHGASDTATIQKFLRVVRELRVRRSELVSQHGAKLLNSRLLGEEERWLVHEQVCVAALDCQDKEVANECLKKLKAKFPSSIRVGRLAGMCLEAQGKWEEALVHYEKLLAESPANATVMKRKVAVERARGNTHRAIEALNEYLDSFMSDVDAWAELGDLYIENLMYKQAAFCFEELITAAPHNYLNHLKYAEVLYTMGGAENVRNSRKYFAAAVDLTGGDSLRALYGLWSATNAIKALKGPKDPEDESPLGDLASKQIIALYKTGCPAKAKIVEACVENQ